MFNWKRILLGLALCAWAVAAGLLIYGTVLSYWRPVLLSAVVGQFYGVRIDAGRMQIWNGPARDLEPADLSPPGRPPVLGALISPLRNSPGTVAIRSRDGGELLTKPPPMLPVWPPFVQAANVYLGDTAVSYSDGRHELLLGRWAAVRALPAWLLVAIALVPSVPLILRFFRRRRLARLKGHCQHCGYDLRGTPDRCPECGREPQNVAVV